MAAVGMTVIWLAILILSHALVKQNELVNWKVLFGAGVKFENL